jgi:hypothetical protein
VSARSFETVSKVLPSVHPPQLKPTIIATTRQQLRPAGDV